MKKKLFMLLLALLAVVCVFASCGDDEGTTTPSVNNNNNTTSSSSISGGNANCAHDFKVTSTVSATCAADGKEISTCSKCGATSEKTLNKLNDHSMVYDETEPTCSAPGLVVGTCSICGHKTETEGKPALGHSGKTLTTVVVTEPTCTEPGTQKQVCSDCGEDQWSAGFKSEIPALGHTYERGENLFDEASGVVYVEAGCGIDGYFARTCQDCGFNNDPITREMYKNLEGKPNSGYDASVYDEMAGWAHVFSVFVTQTEPTCTDPVYLVYKCKNCDAQDNQPQGSAAGHTYNLDENGVEGKDFVTNPMPTCVTEGKRTYLCIVCGVPSDDVNHTVTVPTVEHNTEKHTNEYLAGYVKASCEEPAYRIYKCNKGDCDVVEYVSEGEALGHKWVRNGEASCKTGGLTPYRCTRCKGEKTEQDEYSITMEQAVHSGSLAVEATCSTDAIYLCDECGSEYGPYADDPAYADGFAHGRHEMEYYEDVDATCSSIGYKMYKCKYCTLTGKNTNYNKLDTPMPGDIVPRLSHNFVKESGKLAITPDGVLTCSTCSLKYRDIKTESDSGIKSLCLGTCEGECKCDIKVEWVTYVTPKELDVLAAGEKTVVSSVTWSDGTVVPLAIGGGLIAINGGDSTTYQVELYDSDGRLITTIEEEGANFYLDLYEYSDVAKVAITSSTKATVRYCQLVD